MRPIRLIIVIVAVVAAILTALLARRWVEAQNARPQVVEAPMAKVVVAARDLPAGAAVRAEDMRLDSWPLSAVGGHMVVQKDGADPRLALAGKIARRDMAAGEPIMPQALRTDSAGMLAGMVGPGLRAVSIAISNTSAVSGFVTPGDRVDVVLAADLLRTEGNNAPHSPTLVRYAAETVLAGVKVLAIDQSAARKSDGGPVEGKTATLEVTPKQVELLAAAAQLGSLSLALRGADQAEAEAAAPSYTPDTQASRALHALHGARPQAVHVAAPVLINRAGQISAQSVGR